MTLARHPGRSMRQPELQARRRVRGQARTLALQDAAESAARLDSQAPIGVECLCGLEQQPRALVHGSVFRCEFARSRCTARALLRRGLFFAFAGSRSSGSGPPLSHPARIATLPRALGPKRLTAALKPDAMLCSGSGGQPRSRLADESAGTAARRSSRGRPSQRSPQCTEPHRAAPAQFGVAASERRGLTLT